MSETLIIFSRYPEPGLTKTRMIPALGAAGAAQLQREMTEHTLNTAKSVQSSRNITIEIHFAGGNKQLMREWLGKDIQYIPQVAGDLGHKMQSAFERAFSLNHQRVVTIGIDCPDIDSVILNKAFDSLQTQDLVLGSAEDGGYYLIGLNRSIPQLFQSIDWGTERVFNQTKDIADRINLSLHKLPTLSDIDRPEDLAIWQRSSRRKLR
ncbi:TIGR04282 family arsenosugar biosynthesis glycosyltransferase [Pleurocapsales cyanobacterium LEGE 10410]|nr:TIGR04282 family arsenosugar biosynthesis glycosyltransferase [Pleurocapsales cyanobacterium LEGE 10410]